MSEGEAVFASEIQVDSKRLDDCARLNRAELALKYLQVHDQRKDVLDAAQNLLLEYFSRP